MTTEMTTEITIKYPKFIFIIEEDEPDNTIYSETLTNYDINNIDSDIIDYIVRQIDIICGNDININNKYFANYAEFANYYLTESQKQLNDCVFANVFQATYLDSDGNLVRWNIENFLEQIIEGYNRYFEYYNDCYNCYEEEDEEMRQMREEEERYESFVADSEAWYDDYMDEYLEKKSY